VSAASTIRKIQKKFDRLEKDNERSKSHAHALKYEELLKERYNDDPEFWTWNPNRALNLQDFDYLFIHRAQFNETISTQLEFIASKITHVKPDGDDGYFKKLEQNVGWTHHITPLVICQVRNVDKLVRCGIWANSKNSRRCHNPDCPCCHWNDDLKVAVEAFGAESGTFARMKASDLTASFLTLSFTTNPNNANSAGRDFQCEDISFDQGEPEYDPYPVRLGLSDDSAVDAWLGYEDAKILGLVAQKAMEKVYGERLFSGYRFKIEGAFKLVPGGANQVNLHAHVVANGHESDPQKVADAIMKEMRRELRRYRKELNGTYHPDVLALRLNSAEELERAIKYSDKVIPFGLIVEEAMNRPEAKQNDGSWERGYLSELRTSLERLINDDLPAIFTGSDDPLFKPLRRRKTIGNMTFNDKGTCIGQEPVWHQKVRRKRADQQRQNRKEKKAERQKIAAEFLDEPVAISEKRRKRKRRRSAGRPEKQFASRSNSHDEHYTNNHVVKKHLSILPKTSQVVRRRWDDSAFEEELRRQLPSNTTAPAKAVGANSANIGIEL